MEVCPPEVGRKDFGLQDCGLSACDPCGVSLSAGEGARGHSTAQVEADRKAGCASGLEDMMPSPLY